jgi:hypothetical protein
VMQHHIIYNLGLRSFGIYLAWRTVLTDLDTLHAMQGSLAESSVQSNLSCKVCLKSLHYNLIDGIFNVASILSCLQFFNKLFVFYLFFDFLIGIFVKFLLIFIYDFQ